MSLNVALNIAVSGLFADQKAIAATSENIANVNTENYSRREATFYSDAIPNQFSGVDVEIARAAAARYLQAASYRGAADEGRSGAIAEALARVEASLGSPGENNSFAHKLDDAFAALATVAANPSALAAKADALAALDAAFAAFARTQDAIGEESVAAEARLRLDIERANALLADIYRLNAIVPDSLGAADLLDARIGELSRLISIDVVRNSLGQVSVAAGGTVLADASGYKALGFTAGAPALLTLGSVEPATGAVSPVSADFGAAVASGEIRGLLDLINVELPRLNALVQGAADGIAASFNAAYAANAVVGSTTPTSDVLLLVDAEGRYAVNPALLADPSRFAIARPSGGAPAGANDGAGAAALAAIAALPEARDVAQSVALLGSAANNAQLRASTDRAVSSELAARLANASGVNLDEELSNLILFQRSYGANARVIAAIDELWQTLLSII